MTAGRQTVDESIVRKALSAFADVFADLLPWQKKQMIRLVLQNATITDEELTLSIHGEPITITENKTSGSGVNALPDSGVWLLR